MKRLRLLVVDDEEYMAKLVATLATNAGFEAKVASNATECRDALARNTFDAMILDIVLPNETGLDLITWIAAEGFDLPIILMSGYSEEYVENAAEEGRAQGANIAGAITKPIRAADLSAKLAVLRQRISASAAD